MVKKVKLIDDTPVVVSDSASGGSMNASQVAEMMKYLEAIDWKLWEMLKLMKAEAGEPISNKDK
jgi:hypothetical protein|tara:strand:- start:364 stop:555 length:192 start_codon:yes stop_codon:yes gene_type:complete